MTFRNLVDYLPPIVLAAMVLSLIATLSVVVMDGERYRGVSGKILIERRYDGINERNETIDECRKMLDAVGFVVDSVENVSHGNKTYVRMRGTKPCKKDGELPPR